MVTTCAITNRVVCNGRRTESRLPWARLQRETKTVSGEKHSSCRYFPEKSPQLDKRPGLGQPCPERASSSLEPPGRGVPDLGSSQLPKVKERERVRIDVRLPVFVIVSVRNVVDRLHELFGQAVRAALPSGNPVELIPAQPKGVPRKVLPNLFGCPGVPSVEIPRLAAILGPDATGKFKGIRTAQRRWVSCARDVLA